MPLQEVPVGDYTDITQVISAAAQTAILVETAKFKALIEIVNGTAQSSPDFGEIPPALSARLVAEFEALEAAIDAAPTV